MLQHNFPNKKLFYQSIDLNYHETEKINLKNVNFEFLIWLIQIKQNTIPDVI